MAGKCIMMNEMEKMFNQMMQEFRRAVDSFDEWTSEVKNMV